MGFNQLLNSLFIFYYFEFIYHCNGLLCNYFFYFLTDFAMSKAFRAFKITVLKIKQNQQLSSTRDLTFVLMK